MLLDTDVSPTQEINYLRSFTSGRPQRLVDNYRNQQMRDPVALLKEMWEELERRFGSVAVISNTLLERLRDTATFDERENDNLQQLADLCADTESQVTSSRTCVPQLSQRHTTTNREVAAVYPRQMGERNSLLLEQQRWSVSPLLQIV